MTTSINIKKRSSIDLINTFYYYNNILINSNSLISNSNSNSLINKSNNNIKDETCIKSNFQPISEEILIDFKQPSKKIKLEHYLENGDTIGYCKKELINNQKNNNNQNNKQSDNYDKYFYLKRKRKTPLNKDKKSKIEPLLIYGTSETGDRICKYSQCYNYYKYNNYSDIESDDEKETR